MLWAKDGPMSKRYVGPFKIYNHGPIVRHPMGQWRANVYVLSGLQHTEPRAVRNRGMCRTTVASAVTRVFSGCKPIKGLTVITGVIHLIPPVLSSETLLYGFLGRQFAYNHVFNRKKAKIT